MSVFKKTKLPLLLGCVLVAGLAVGGCRKEEQGRPLNFEKGSYLGKADQNLTEDQVNDLRYRADAQR